MALTNEELQRAIASYQGSNAPQPLPTAQPVVAPAMDPGVPAVVPVRTPPPVVAQALPPSAPETYQLPTPQVTNSTGALREMDAGTQGQLEAEEHKAVAQTLANDEQGKLIAQQNAIEANAQAENQKKVEEGRQRVAAIYDQAKAIDSEADKIQIKDKRTTTQKVLGILGLALASVADGLSGFSGKQTNFAGELDKSLTAAVDKDLAMQREAINDKRKQSAAKYSEMGIAQKLFVDDVESATKYATALRKDMYARELDAAAKRSQNPVIQAEGAATAAKILQDNAKEKAQLLTSKENARIAAAAAAQKTAALPGNTPIQIIQQKVAAGGVQALTPNEKQELDTAFGPERAEQIRLEKEKANGKVGAVIPGYEPVVSDAPQLAPGDLHKAREIAAGVKGVESAGLRMADLYEKIEKAEKDGNGKEADRLRGEYYTTGGQYLTQRSLATGQGVVNKADADRDAKEGAVPPPPGSGDAALASVTNVWKGVKPSADLLRQNARDTMADGQAKLESYNLQPAKKIQAGGKAVKAEVAPDSNAPVQFNLGGKIGSIPADQVEAFQKKYPSAKRVE